MTSPVTKNQLLAKLPKVFIEPALQREMITFAKFMTVNKGDTIVSEGQYLVFLPIVVKGEIEIW